MIANYRRTCSLDHPVDGCVSFARNVSYLQKAFDCEKELKVFVPRELAAVKSPTYRVVTWGVDDPEWEFVKYHNQCALENDYDPLPDEIHESAQINPMATIGNEGMRYLRKGHEVISMIHTGRVVIKENVVVGPHSSVAKATMDTTLVCREVKIGAGVQIGHNCLIGEYTIITDGTIIGGSVCVGADCWIGLNSTVRNGIKICDQVLLGCGTSVIRDIDEPGMYVGVPARKIRDWDGRWL